VLVFAYVCVAWVFVRATSFDNALAVLERIAHIGAGELDHANLFAALLVALAAAAASHFVPPRTAAWMRDRFVAAPPVLQGAMLVIAAVALRELAHAQPKIVPFIYFQF
jgi:alginate O-acetyltransferase complex protein AlgI